MTRCELVDKLFIAEMFVYRWKQAVQEQCRFMTPGYKSREFKWLKESVLNSVVVIEQVAKWLWIDKTPHTVLCVVLCVLSQGLCKLGSAGGDDYALRQFAEGSTEKLAKQCRK